MIDEESIKEAHRGEWLAFQNNLFVASHPSFHQLHLLLKERKIQGNLWIVRSPSEEDQKYGLML